MSCRSLLWSCHGEVTYSSTRKTRLETPCKLVSQTLDGKNIVPCHDGPDESMLIFCRCIALNATSLALGLLGNAFLLCNFTRIIRYIIALPASIICWTASMALVSGLDQLEFADLLTLH
jgi:hypothetical protein